MLNMKSFDLSKILITSMIGEAVAGLITSGQQPNRIGQLPPGVTYSQVRGDQILVFIDVTLREALKKWYNLGLSPVLKVLKQTVSRESWNHSLNKWSDIISPFILNDNIICFMAFLPITNFLPPSPRQWKQYKQWKQCKQFKWRCYLDLWWYITRNLCVQQPHQWSAL